MTELAQKKCEPCEGKTSAFTKEQAVEYLKKVENWQLSDDSKVILRNFTMKNFLAAVDFINGIAKVAESENHHPDIHLTGYRKLRVELSTHSIGGLSENDFILAAKLNGLPKQLKTIEVKSHHV